VWIIANWVYKPTFKAKSNRSIAHPLPLKNEWRDSFHLGCWRGIYCGGMFKSTWKLITGGQHNFIFPMKIRKKKLDTYLIWLVDLPLWKIWLSWDDNIPNWMGKSFKIPWFQSPPTRKPWIFLWIFVDFPAVSLICPAPQRKHGPSKLHFVPVDGDAEICAKDLGSTTIWAWLNIPSGKHTKSYWKWPYTWLIYLLKIVIFKKLCWFTWWGWLLDDEWDFMKVILQKSWFFKKKMDILDG